MVNTIHSLDKIEIVNVERQKSLCGAYKALVLDIYCNAESNRWIKFKLVPFEQLIPPEDGVYHYQLKAINTKERPTKKSDRITTQILQTPSDFKEIVIHSETNSISLPLKNFETFEHRNDNHIKLFDLNTILTSSIILVALFFLARWITFFFE